MTRLFLALTLLGTLLLTAITTSGAAGALAGDTDTDDTFTTTAFTNTNPQKVGTDTVYELNGTAKYTGRLTGTLVRRGDRIAHADGTASFYYIETFTGTIDGVSGVVTFYTSGGGGADRSYWATAIVLNAAGELAGLTGQVDLVGTVLDGGRGPAGTYTADFD